MGSQGSCVLVRGFADRGSRFWGAIRSVRSVCGVADGALQPHAKQKGACSSRHPGTAEEGEIRLGKSEGDSIKNQRAAEPDPSRRGGSFWVCGRRGRSLFPPKGSKHWHCSGGVSRERRCETLRETVSCLSGLLPAAPHGGCPARTPRPSLAFPAVAVPPALATPST